MSPCPSGPTPLQDGWIRSGCLRVHPARLHYRTGESVVDVSVSIRPDSTTGRVNPYWMSPCPSGPTPLQDGWIRSGCLRVHPARLHYRTGESVLDVSVSIWPDSTTGQVNPYWMSPCPSGQTLPQDGWIRTGCLRVHLVWLHYRTGESVLDVSLSIPVWLHYRMGESVVDVSVSIRPDSTTGRVNP